MKCTIFLFIYFYMCAAHALHTQASARKCHTHAYHTCVPHTRTKVQFKVQLRGETVSVHEDIKSIDIGE